MAISINDAGEGIGRRQLLARCAAIAALPGGLLAHTAAPAQAKTDAPPYGYAFQDYWTDKETKARKRRLQLLGNKTPLDKDVAAADALIKAAPKGSPLAIMEYFAGLTQLAPGSREPFNSRWSVYENPIIVWFFHATNTKPDGDCTSWCAAFMSFTLERAGLKSPHSASSQDFANYAAAATTPHKGDIVVFQNVGDPAHGHVALYLEETADKIRILGGNQGAGGDIPSCPKGFPITTIRDEWRDKAGAHQKVRTIRHY